MTVSPTLDMATLSFRGLPVVIKVSLVYLSTIVLKVSLFYLSNIVTKVFIIYLSGIMVLHVFLLYLYSMMVPKASPSLPFHDLRSISLSLSCMVMKVSSLPVQHGVKGLDGVLGLPVPGVEDQHHKP
jgi:hypothetical protein